MFRVRILALLLAAVLFASGREAFAFSADPPYWIRNRTVVMHLSLAGGGFLQDGSASYNQAAANALTAWNQHLVHLQFSWVLDSGLPPTQGDGDNSVFFSSTVFGDSFGSNTIAITLTSSVSSGTTECDVIFNTRETWDSYRGFIQFEAQDLHRVALHEFGHVLGLNHPNESGQQVAAIMNSRIGDLDALTTDDISGARSIYDTGPPFLASNPSPNLVNLSTRALVGTGDRVLIGGFIIQGSQPATVILRAIGNSLGARRITDPLRDPVIELRNAGGGLIAENDDWVTGPDAASIASYRLDPSGSLESALLRTLQPGNYTAIVRSFDNGDGNLTGTALVELFDLHTTNGRAGNISSRGQVLTGDNIMIAGFIIGGPQSKQIVVRGIGPSLANFGVSGPLADPTLDLVNASGTIVGSNDDWAMHPDSARVRDANLAPTNGEEAALYADLTPGAYTALMRGFNGGTGIGLVEVYDLTPPPN